MDQLDRVNKHGTPLRDSYRHWQVGEANLCNETSQVHVELDKFPQNFNLASVWNHLSLKAQEAVADAWCADYEEQMERKWCWIIELVDSSVGHSCNSLCDYVFSNEESAQKRLKELQDDESPPELKYEIHRKILWD